MAREGDRKVEKLKNGQFSDMTVKAAAKELVAAGWADSEAAVMEWWKRDSSTITFEGVRYTLMTLRWV